MRLACVAATALALCGCDSAGEVHLLSARVLPPIAEPPPPLPKAGYREENLGDPNTFSLAFLRARTESAAEKAALRVLVRAGFASGYQKAWTRERGNDRRSAQIVIFLFRDNSATDDALAGLRRVFDEQVAEESRKTANVDASGLGEESWAERIVGEDDEFAYGWRSRNIVVVIDMVCYGDCGPADRFREAARAYADAVDSRAEKMRG